MTWSNRYVGIPFVDKGRDRSGVDCWGLVKMVQEEQFNRTVKEFGTEYGSAVDDLPAIKLLFENEIGNWDIVKEPRVGDVICVRWKGVPVHFGVVSEPGRFIHARQGAGVVVTRYDSLLINVVGFFRYRGNNV